MTMFIDILIIITLVLGIVCLLATLGYIAQLQVKKTQVKLPIPIPRMKLNTDKVVYWYDNRVDEMSYNELKTSFNEACCLLRADYHKLGLVPEIFDTKEG